VYFSRGIDRSLTIHGRKLQKPAVCRITLNAERAGVTARRNVAMLTPRREALLFYIDRQLKETGRAPSGQEMKEALKFGHLSSVYRAIAALEEEGFITRRPGRPRELTVSRLPKDRRGLPAVIHRNLLAQSLSVRNAPTADGPPGPQLPDNDGHMVGDTPVGPPRDVGDGATTFGTQGSGILPSVQALRMAAEATRKGYGLTEPTRHPEIVAQAIELAFLLVAYGLVPMEPGIAVARSNMAKESSRTADIAETKEQLRYRGQHIVVVDDVSDVLVSVTAFLVSAGFVVTTAADGNAALRLIASDPLISVLVTDFVMPGMTGVDLIAQAIQARPGLKALLITGYPHADGLADLPAGIPVLTKPFRRAALIEQVSVLAGETWPAHANVVAEFAHVIN
jgi:CheY-like chemotaxis protein/DNA-binding MarR family transcriptional regulator